MLDRLTSLFDDRALEPEMLRLIDGSDTGVVVTVVALATAVGIGVVHAIGPGHGKVLIGAYLASTRGRARDAVALGLLVAVMHTASVLALGLVLQVTQRVPGFTWLEPTLMLASAAAVTAVGAALVVRQMHSRRARRASAVVGGAGATHDHSRDHDHGHHHHHHHDLPEGVAPLSRAGILALASAGGLLPSPAAFLVLATAMAIGRTAFGLALVAAFGLGLAMTLTAVGLLVLWGRNRVAVAGSTGRVWLRRVHAVVPMLAAWLVLAGGLLLGAGALLMA